MICIENARLHAELENISFCYAYQLVMIASRKSVISLDEYKHQSRFLISVRLKVSMCLNSYQNMPDEITSV